MILKNSDTYYLKKCSSITQTHTQKFDAPQIHFRKESKLCKFFKLNQNYFLLFFPFEINNLIFF